MRVGEKDGFGRYGYLDGDAERIICHECGSRYKSVASHAQRTHQMTADEYRIAHGIPQTTSLIAPSLKQTFSGLATSRIGSEGWERMVSKRDPTAASHARDPEDFKPRGRDVERKNQQAIQNLQGARKPITRRCAICNELIRGRKGQKTCSPLCQRILIYESVSSAPAAKWLELHEQGESWSSIGRQYGFSHTNIRNVVSKYRRYLSDKEYLSKHGPGELPENRP